MQDPRIRLTVLILLSITAFISVPGAIGTLLWWMICSGRKQYLKQAGKGLGALLIITLLAAALIALSGGDGISYFIRIGVIILLASWAYKDRYPGDLLDTLVWAFGKRVGFTVGLIAELSLSSAEVLGVEIIQIRVALSQKGQRIGPRIIVPVISSLLIRQLQLAEDRAVILTLRGFQGETSFCPSFHTAKKDQYSGGLAVLFSFWAMFVTYIWPPVQPLLFQYYI